MLIHVQCSSLLRKHKQKLHIAYLTSLHNSILVLNEEQLRLKMLKKLRTASLNSEFTGSYKNKSVFDSEQKLTIAEIVFFAIFANI